MQELKRDESNMKIFSKIPINRRFYGMWPLLSRRHRIIPIRWCSQPPSQSLNFPSCIIISVFQMRYSWFELVFSLQPINYFFVTLSALWNQYLARSPLSSAQLESIGYAAHTHQVYLPSGQRKGFYLGDSAGVGKGRQLAGITFENHLLGRKKHVWISCSSDLREDAERDLVSFIYYRVSDSKDIFSCSCCCPTSERRVF